VVLKPVLHAVREAVGIELGDAAQHSGQHHSNWTAINAGFVNAHKLDAKLLQPCHRNDLGFHVAAKATDVLHDEMRHAVFVFLNERKTFFKNWARCFPRAFALGHEDLENGQTVGPAPVLATLLLSRQIGFVSLLLFRSADTTENDGCRPLYVTVVLGHEGGILQEANVARN
jgi:hypothetical protein